LRANLEFIESYTIKTRRMAAGVSVDHVISHHIITGIMLTLVHCVGSVEFSLLQSSYPSTYDPYICPLDCMCHKSNQTVNSMQQYYLICTVANISPSTSAATSMIQTISNSQTAALYVICKYSQINYVEDPPMSELWDGAFESMTNLRQLTFDKCAFQKLTRGAFEGLTYLKKLTVRHANIKELDANLLSNIRLLENLEISQSSLKKLFPLCAYKSLQSLNLSFNSLNYLEDIGINCDGKYLQKLGTLDVSNNFIAEIPKWLSENLSSLHYLHMSGNLIYKYDIYPFKNFVNLYLLDISNNSLTEIREDLLQGCHNLQFLYMSKNPVSYLHRHFLASVPNLVELEMADMNLSDNVWLEIADLNQDHLKNLNLSLNKLTKINEDTMSNFKLKALNLSHNLISSLTSEAFNSQYNLMTLDLSYNSIPEIPFRFSQNLSELIYLRLNNNNIRYLQTDALTQLKKLEIFDISFNGLLELTPKTFTALDEILMVDLSNNYLKVLPREFFSKSKKMIYLNVSYNSLQELPFLNYNEALEKIDAGYNNISNILAQTLQDLKELLFISLSHNRLRSLPIRMFKGCDNLKIIDLSFNFLTNLEDDTFTSSPKVTEIDLSHNEMTATNNVFRDLNYLKVLQLSYNKISRVLRNQLPKSLETLDLSHNNIHQISAHTFKSLSNLQEVNLSNNNLTSLSRMDVEIAFNMLFSPTFNLFYNPLVCDCKLGWLKDWYDEKLKDMGTLPTFQTTLKYGCLSPFYSNKMPIHSLKREEFLCHYQNHCEDTCMCCDYDACYCKYICPPSCQCYIGDDFLHIHQVHCYDADLTNVPEKIPEGATHLRLDDNNIQVLQEHKFLVLKFLIELYLNNSQIHTIQNNTFRGLKSVKVLYLNDNLLTIIYSGIFRGLDNLEKLYLQNNGIFSIEPSALLSLPNLYLINLRENDLVMPPIEAFWNFTNRSKENGLKVQLSLSRNPYTCEIDFVCKFVQFIRGNSDCIEDISFIECISSSKTDKTSQNAESFSLLDFQLESCSENQSIPANMSRNTIHPSSNKAETYALIAACVVIAFGLALLIVAYMNRNFLQVLCFTRFGLRVFKMAKASDDNERPYDAFISYSNKDEDFVIHQLAPRLENGDKKFKLCVHYRDFPVGACIAETIVRSVEASKRTILVVSDNFLDSEWCRFEFQTAHQQVLNERRNRVILILMHDLDTEKLDSTLKVYMRTRTYLKYDDPWFWEKLMFAMPDIRHRKPEQVVCQMHQRPGMEYMPQNMSLQHQHRRIPVSSNGSRCETIHNDMYEIPILDTCNVHYQLANGRCCSTHTNSAYHNSDLSDSTSGFHTGSICGSYGHYEEVGPGSSSMQSTPHKFIGTPPPVPSIPKEGFLPMARVKTAYV
ncbi:hypothetical protein Btru_000319, partial [Bulinus truncatus]